MDNWDEVRTAFHVARAGTVSGAAETLGVHHATVIRHIDALEGRLGVKLFQRHARGYTVTEAGEDMCRVASATDDQFQQMVSRIKERKSEVSGELLVTSLLFLSELMVPALTSFREKYPEVNIRFLTDERLFRLEYGEAHVAIRAGRAPQEPDNVVQPFQKMSVALYASKSYIEKMGMPNGPEDLARHNFVATESALHRAPTSIWMTENIPESQIVFRANDTSVLRNAVKNGMGIGFLTMREGAAHPDLVQVLGTRPDWISPLWVVTHVDLHRSAKVQAFLAHLKEFVAKECPDEPV